MRRIQTLPTLRFGKPAKAHGRTAHGTGPAAESTSPPTAAQPGINLRRDCPKASFRRILRSRKATPVSYSLPSQLKRLLLSTRKRTANNPGHKPQQTLVPQDESAVAISPFHGSTPRILMSFTSPAQS